MNTTHYFFKQLTGIDTWALPAGWMSRAGAVMTCVLLGGCQLADMAQFSYANATATHSWSDEARSTTVRFELVDDHIVLPVSVNDSEPLYFVLDSGAGATVILESPLTRTLPLEIAGELEVSGVGTGPNPVAHIVKNTDISVGDVRLQGLSAVYLPLASVPFFDTLDEVYFDGVIGAPFFERFVVEIDYDRQLISFSEPGSLKVDNDEHGTQWREVPLEIEGGVPYLTTRISSAGEQSVEVKLLVDTGYRGPVSLTTKTHEKIVEPLEYYPTVSQGLSGDVESRVGLPESLGLGGYTLGSVSVSYSIAGGESENGSNGLLGNEVLSRFNLVFDYPNKRMLVAPNQQFAMPISADRSGLLIRPHRLGAVVKSVARDESGLRVNDVITSIDETPMTRSSITQLKRLLASDRDKVSMCWLSEGRSQCGSLALASRFEQHGQ